MLRTIRTTKAHVSLTYARTFTNNLYAENISAGIDETVTLSFDLNCNLRTRNKQTNTYVDARNLADGDIARLETLQFDDDGVLKHISKMLNGIDPLPEIWRLIILLDREHEFDVRPEYNKINNYGSLTLTVIEPTKKPK